MRENLCRSLLYVPGHRADLLSKAMKGEADIVVLDLEDSVPIESKDSARSNIAAFQFQARQAGKSLAVRINSDSDLVTADVDSISQTEVEIVVAPKVDEAEQVATLVELFLEKQGENKKSLSIVAMIESPQGLFNATAIAYSHPWVVALNLGTEDFSLEMGMEPSWDSLLYPSQQLLLAAKSAGKLALGYSGSIAEFRDLSLFSSIVERSAKLGFDGGFAIHPRQIEPLNRAFSPKLAEVEFAQRVVTAFDEAIQQGNGAVSVDGKMVDLPVANRAKVILAKAQQIESKQASHSLVEQ